MMRALRALAYRLLQRRREEALLDVETVPKRRLTLVLALAVGFASLPIIITYLLLVLSSFSNEAGMLTIEDVFRTTYSLRPWIDFFTGKVAPAAGRLYTTWEIISIIVNTLVVALGVTAVVVFTSVLAGYAFSRMSFPGRRPLMQLLILLHAFPGVAL
ncbi:MAG TPA: carbohydrate ABC transporter permease, partial [Pyrodictium sp.]|nr:carbohydrate ABC transporter permease [Pyrodictium sp.]